MSGRRRRDRLLPMTDASDLLLLNDPAAFLAVIQNDDIGARVRALHTLDDAVACETLRHGLVNDRKALPGLAQFYRETFMQAPVERRLEIYGHVKWISAQMGGWTAGAFTPFMLLDDDIGIVSTATIDYCSLGSLFDEGDPLGRPRDAMAMVLRQLGRNPAAILGGLLCLGDPRVCALVAPLSRQMDEHQARTFTRCSTGLTYKCVVDFYLQWLDELADRRDPLSEANFGNAAAGLTRVADHPNPFVIDGLRPFPVPPPGEPWDVTRIAREPFVDSIAERLFDLEARESTPKVMPHALRAFGLVPRSRPGDIALMQ